MVFKVEMPSIICILTALLAAPRLTVANPSDVQQFINDMERFDNNLFAELAQKNPDKNIIFSPFSIQISLAMARMGAEGQTAAEIDQAMVLSTQNTETLANNYHAILEKYEKSDILTMANKIYVMTGYSVNDTFNQLLTEKFYSKVDSINFADSVKAADTINSWVEEKTNNWIKDLISPNMLTSATRMMLVNAINFKGEWAHRFPTYATVTSDFYLDETNKVDVEMMHLKKRFKYAELDDLDAKALEMRYKHSDLSMLIILPNKRSGLDELINKLKETSLNEIVQHLDYRQVVVDFPKFRVDFDDELSETLSNLGLQRMFSGNAEFGKMLESGEGFHVSSVIHKAFISVNEYGTEAAAATATLLLGAYPFGVRYVPPKPFKADHPFYYIIKNDNNLTLFKGVYKNKV